MPPVLVAEAGTFFFRRACAGHVGSSREELIAIFFSVGMPVLLLHIYIYIYNAVYGNDHLRMYIKKGVGCPL